MVVYTSTRRFGTVPVFELQERLCDDAVWYSTSESLIWFVQTYSRSYLHCYLIVFQTIWSSLWHRVVGLNFSTHPTSIAPFFLSNNPTSICLSSSRDSHCLIPIGPNFEVLDKFWKTGLGKKIYWATRIMEITKLSIFEVRNSEVIFFVKPKGHQVPLGELIARIFEEYLCQ